MKRLCIAALLAVVFLPTPSIAQDVPIGELVIVEGAVARRLMGYGLVVGLDGTGDRSFGGANGAAHTVRSVVNVLERHGVQVPEDRLRIRNVAAVLVTAEISPYARPGARFDVTVSSVGDARSLEGGVLYMTPLALGPGVAPVASAQGGVVVSAAPGRRQYFARHGTATVRQGGALEVPLTDRPDVTEMRLLLTTPDLGLATRIRAAIDQALGDGSATVEDPGTVRVTAGEGGADAMAVLAEVQALVVPAEPGPSIVVDARSGAVVAGGRIVVGPASVSQGGITLTVGGSEPDPVPAGGAPSVGTSLGEDPEDGRARVAEGASVQDVVGALHAAGARPGEVARILLALREVGALRADVRVR